MNDSGVPALRFSVLGPLRVWRHGTAVDLGPVQQRVVLAVLALPAGRPVGRQQMIDAVWGEAQPRNAVNLVQRHVSGLLAGARARPARLHPVGPVDLDRGR